MIHRLELPATPLDRTNSHLAARLTTMPPEQHDRIVAFKVFACDGIIERVRTEIAWAQRGLQLIEELSAGEQQRRNY